MRDEPEVRLKCLNAYSDRYHKGCRFILTTGRWPRKLESAKKCVTTYLPNESAPKMDGAKVCLLIPERLENLRFSATLTSSRVGGR